jgi:hypothetical protein
MDTTHDKAIPVALALGFALALASPAGATSAKLRIQLSATAVDADAAGTGRLAIRDRRSSLSGTLDVRARRLDANATYRVTIDGVEIGSLTTSRAGKGRARFRTNPANARDQLLGVDPRGRALAIVGDGGAVLTASVGTRGLDPNDVRCCLPDDSGPECEDRTAAECTAEGGVNMGPGSCLPDPCAGGSTSTTLPGGGAATVVVTCERRADRSRASVNGKNLASGNYTARLTSGGNGATTGSKATIGDEVEFDFDSEPDDIAAGATAIGAGFLEGTPPQATGEILNAADQVVVSATVTCAQN